MKIKDLTTGQVFEYGSNRHHALRISDDGRTLSFEHLQNGDGSRYGDYRFVDDDEEKIPSEIEDEYGADSYFNIGGFGKQVNRMKEVFDKLISRLEEEIEKHSRMKKESNSLHKMHYHMGIIDAYNKEIEIVNQVAEEYSGKFVSKNEVGYMLDSIKMRGDETWMDYYHKALKGLCELFGEEYNNGWIPCSERLPNESGEYLTYVDYADETFIAIDEIDCEGILKKWNCTPNYHVLAWMPLPARYKKEGDK